MHRTTIFIIQLCVIVELRHLKIVDEDLWLLLRKQRHDTSPRAEVYVMTKAVVRLQESLSSLSRTIVKSLTMPRRCVAADCKTTSGMGYSLHSFPTDENMRRRWTSAVKRYRKDWNGPSTSSLLCSRHFTEDSFETEGSLYRDTFGIPAQKRLKPDAVPTVFPKSIDQLHTSSSSASHSRPLSERREQRSVSP